MLVVLLLFSNPLLGGQCEFRPLQTGSCLGSHAGVVPQTELAMWASYGIGKGALKGPGAHSSFILIRKKKYLVTLALVSPTRNRGSRTRTPIFRIENQQFLVQMAQAWPGPAQAQPGAKFGNMGTWKSRNLGSKKSESENCQDPNPFCPKCWQGLD